MRAGILRTNANISVLVNSLVGSNAGGDWPASLERNMMQAGEYQFDVLEIGAGEKLAIMIRCWIVRVLGGESD